MGKIEFQNSRIQTNIFIAKKSSFQENQIGKFIIGQSILITFVQFHFIENKYKNYLIFYSMYLLFYFIFIIK